MPAQETAPVNTDTVQQKTSRARKMLPDAVAHVGELAIILGIPIGDIDESPTQPRRAFRGLDELAEQIKLRGVLQAPTARPSPTTSARYELVFGARRFRAAKLAGLTEFPLVVRGLSDDEVLEIQIVENSQREDIHPLEEADGYRSLHEKHGYSAEEIAARVGKPLATVRQRLKLCALLPAAREAFLADKFTTGVALALARIPHADLQAEAFCAVLDRNEHQHEPSEALERRPITLQDVSWELRSDYMLVLEKAPFDRTDPDLVAGAPDCGSCPKRTGNQRDLFADIAAKDDLCTDAKCFASKKDAAWEKREAAAKAKGLKVLTDKQASKVFSPYSGGHLAHGSGFVDLAEKTYSDGAAKTNRALLGKCDVPIVVARDADGRAHELVAEDDFRRVAKAAGTSVPSSSSRRANEATAADKARRAREAKARLTAEAELMSIVNHLAHDPNPKAIDGHFWFVFVNEMIDYVWQETRVTACRRRDIDPKGKDAGKLLRAHAASLSEDEARAMSVELLLTGRQDGPLKAFRDLCGIAKGGDLKKAPPAKKGAARKPAAAAKAPTKGTGK